MKSTPTPGMKTVISKKTTSHFYLKVQFTKDEESEEGKKENLTCVSYKFVVMQAVKELLGMAGASTQVDVLKTWGDGLAIIRIPNTMKEKIWSALTLYSQTQQGVPCSFRMLQTSPYLMALAMDSGGVGT